MSVLTFYFLSGSLIQENEPGTATFMEDSARDGGTVILAEVILLEFLIVLGLQSILFKQASARGAGPATFLEGWESVVGQTTFQVSSSFLEEMQRVNLIQFKEDLGKELGIAIFLEGWENGLGTVASPVRLTD